MKKAILGLALSGVVAGAVGGYSAYTYYTNPALQIAKEVYALSETTEMYVDDRFEQEIKWFEKDGNKHIGVNTTIPLMGDSKHAIDFYSQGAITLSSDLGFNGFLSDNKNGHINYYNGNPNNKVYEVTVDQLLNAYGLDISNKEEVKDFKVKDITDLLFKNNTNEMKLTKSETIDLLKSYPKEMFSKKDGKFFIELNKERLKDVYIKTYDIQIKKLKDAGASTKFVEQQKTEAIKNIDAIEKVDVKIALEFMQTGKKASIYIAPENMSLDDFSKELNKTNNSIVRLDISLSSDWILINGHSELGDAMFSSKKTAKGSYLDEITHNNNVLYKGQHKDGKYEILVNNEKAGEILTIQNGDSITYALDSELLKLNLYLDKVEFNSIVKETEDLTGEPVEEVKNILLK